MAFTYNIIKAVEEEKDEARAEGRTEGRTEKGVQVFLNALKHGMSKEEAKVIAEIDDELIKLALKRMEEM